jgi:hypothetical protein
MTMQFVRRACAVALACVCSFSVSVAWAGTYILKTSRPGNQTFEESTDPHLLDLGESHGTSLSVQTAGPATRLLILVNAECTVAGTTTEDWLRVEILVDGIVLTPSGGLGHAVCTADADGLLNNWVMAASDASTVVGAGTHTVELRGSLAFGAGVPGADWWIGDLSLIVIANNE